MAFLFRSAIRDSSSNLEYSLISVSHMSLMKSYVQQSDIYYVLFIKPSEIACICFFWSGIGKMAIKLPRPKYSFNKSQPMI